MSPIRSSAAEPPRGDRQRARDVVLRCLRDGNVPVMGGFIGATADG